MTRYCVANIERTKTSRTRCKRGVVLCYWKFFILQLIDAAPDARECRNLLRTINRARVAPARRNYRVARIILREFPLERAVSLS